MTTYIYETIQTSDFEDLTHYEIEQNDNDAPPYASPGGRNRNSACNRGWSTAD